MLEQSLRVFTRRVARLLECRARIVFLVDHERSNWCCVFPGLRPANRRIPIEQRHRRRGGEVRPAVRVADAYEDPRFNRDVDLQTGFRTRSVLCLPLHDRAGNVFAVTQLLNRRDGQPFDENDERALRGVRRVARRPARVAR